MDIPETARPFWRAFETHVGRNLPDRLYDIFYFDDNERSANELAARVRSGVKRATGALPWSFEADHRALPKPAISASSPSARGRRCLRDRDDAGGRGRLR